MYFQTRLRIAYRYTGGSVLAMCNSIALQIILRPMGILYTLEKISEMYSSMIRTSQVSDPAYTSPLKCSEEDLPLSDRRESLCENLIFSMISLLGRP
jgi:hypothetical protein